MIDIIAAVLRAHLSEVNNANGTGWWSDCGCDDQDSLCFSGSGLADMHHATHVAERVAEALQLTLQRSQFDEHGRENPQHRYVTPWTAVEPTL